MLSRTRALRHLRLQKYGQSSSRPTARAAPHAKHLSPGMHKRTFCDVPRDSDGKSVPSGRQTGLLGRLLSPDSSGQNALLRALGYYSAESRAIGVGNSLYEQALTRSEAAVLAEFGADADFSARFEMLAVHVYLTLRRLRAEKGSVYESEVKTVMQCMFDVFWTDVRTRMIMKEHKMNLIMSGKWIKECEQIFFGMALSFDETWDSEGEMKECVKRNITCLGADEERVERFRRYMAKERRRLERTTIEQVWEGVCWDDKYSGMQSA